MDQLLLQLGINLTSSFIYDVVKKYLQTPNPTIDGLKNKITSCLIINGAEIKASTIVDFMAKNGDIMITGAKIYAPNSINMQSGVKNSLIFGNNSESMTDKTKIQTGNDAQIKVSGGGGISQNEDGSISFFT